MMQSLWLGFMRLVGVADAAIEAVMKLAPPPSKEKAPWQLEEESNDARDVPPGSEGVAEEGEAEEVAYGSGADDSEHSDRSDDDYEQIEVTYVTPSSVITTSKLLKREPRYRGYFNLSRTACGYLGRTVPSLWSSCGRGLVLVFRVWMVWGTLMLWELLFAFLLLLVVPGGSEGVWWRVFGAGMLCVLVVWEACGLAVLLALGVWSMGLVPRGIRALEPAQTLSSLMEALLDIYRARGKGRHEPVPEEEPEELDPSEAPVVPQKEWGKQ